MNPISLNWLHDAVMTLTDIHIKTFKREGNIVQADVLLKHCPNLEKLFFQGMILKYPPSSSTLWKPNLNDFKHTKLPSLSLLYMDIIETAPGFSFITPFLQAAPKLKQLHLNVDNFDDSMDPSDMILFLQKNCPHTTVLAFCSLRSNGLFDDIPFNTTATTTKTTTVALLTEESKRGIKEGNLKYLILCGCKFRPIWYKISLQQSFKGSELHWNHSILLARSY